MFDSEIIEINDNHTNNAKILASCLSTPQGRKRGMIDMLGINCAISYLQSCNFRIDTKRSVFKIPLLFEEFKISDIYYNNYRIDVITLYKEKTVKIPKIHADIDIMPHFYFVVQIGTKIKEAKMIGFIDAKSILSATCDSKYFYPSLDLVFDIKRFATLTKRPILTKNMLTKHIDCLGLFLKFIDNDLSSVYKKQLIQHLMNCESCRTRFIDALEFEKLAGSIKKYPSLMQKYTSIPTSFDSLKEETKSENPLTSSAPVPSEVFYKEESYSSFDKLKKDALSEQDKKIDRLQLSKRFIETVFNDMPKIELPKFKTFVATKSRRVIIVIFAMFFALSSFALIALKDKPEIERENEEIANLEPIPDDFIPDDDYVPGEAKLIPKQRDISEFNINQPISTAPVYTPNVSKISFEAPESLVKDANYTKFLQLVGKNVKLNLQNDLLLVNDIPTSKVAKVDIKMSSNAGVGMIKIVQSSGSKAIDASIKKVVNDTLKYMKPPGRGIISKMETVTLCIELN